MPPEDTTANRRRPEGRIRLTIALPTYRREEILVRTVARILEVMDPQTMELLLVDQTPEHQPEVRDALHAWAAAGRLRWIQLEAPSLTRARNTALREASGDVLLFLDDDILVPDHLFRSHLAWFDDEGIVAVTGQVYNCLDPSSPPPLDRPEEGTSPHSAQTTAREANNISGGNHSVRRKAALAIGGFDEAFLGAALAEDLDFARRLMAGGHRIWYDPDAWIIHLGVRSGGCAVSGETLWPEWTHSASLWLYAFRHGRTQGNFGSMLWMAFRHGPGRREVVRNPLRWPGAWWGWLRGATYGWRHRRMPS